MVEEVEDDNGGGVGYLEEDEVIEGLLYKLIKLEG